LRPGVLEKTGGSPQGFLETESENALLGWGCFGGVQFVRTPDMGLERDVDSDQTDAEERRSLFRAIQGRLAVRV
jgi:hypothetical protein